MSSDGSKVGYGRPPQQHRFKKGQSGNARGRPRKSGNRKTVLLQTLDDLVLAEADRMIAVREGDLVVEMTVQEAFVRTMEAKALKGDRVFAKLFQQLLSSAQKETTKDRREFFEAACQYKWHWEEEIARCKREGLPLPEPLPHPDDMIINPRVGHARIAGPMCAEEKEAVDQLIDIRDTLLERIEDPDYLAFAGPELRRKLRARELERIQEINDHVPPRLKREYEGPLD